MAEAEAQLEEAKTLAELALANGVLKKAPARGPSLPAHPALSRAIGCDLVKKASKRKNRFLLCLPGFLSQTSAGEIGELAQMNTTTPVLYINHPQGRFKLFGSIVFPKTSYLSMKIASKEIMCEDHFESLIVFSKVYWVGKKEENESEKPLPLPDCIKLSRDDPAVKADFEFVGGAGLHSELAEQEPPVGVKEGEKEEVKHDSEGAQQQNEADPGATRTSARTKGERRRYHEDLDEVSEDDGASEGNEPMLNSGLIKLQASNVDPAKASTPWDTFFGSQSGQQSVPTSKASVPKKRKSAANPLEPSTGKEDEPNLSKKGTSKATKKLKQQNTEAWEAPADSSGEPQPSRASGRAKPKVKYVELSDEDED